MAANQPAGAYSTTTEFALQRVADYIQSDACKSVIILTGAGTSVAAGIPDFRSPGGLYQTLKPELITASPTQRALLASNPTYVVEKGMFMQTQFPYLEVRRPFILGTQEKRWRATISHRFFELLYVKTGKLTRLFTQNIDGLDYQCDSLPADKIVPVHGSIGRVACEACGAAHDLSSFCSAVRSNIKDIYGVDSGAPKESTPVPCPNCARNTLKPATVLFGSNLPAAFFQRKAADLGGADLVIVAGTSLVVSPANSIVPDAPRTVCPPTGPSYYHLRSH